MNTKNVVEKKFEYKKTSSVYTARNDSYLWEAVECEFREIKYTTKIGNYFFFRRSKALNSSESKCLRSSSAVEFFFNVTAGVSHLIIAT